MDKETIYRIKELFSEDWNNLYGEASMGPDDFGLKDTLYPKNILHVCDMQNEVLRKIVFIFDFGGYVEREVVDLKRYIRTIRLDELI